MPKSLLYTVFFTSLLTAGCGSGLCLTEARCGFTSTTVALLSIESGPTFSFGPRAPATSTEATFILHNSGFMDAREVVATALSTPFAFSGGLYPGAGGDCGSTIGPGESCLIVLSFTTPGSTASYGATLAITYHDGVSNRAATLALDGSSEVTTFSQERGPNAIASRALVTPQGIYLSGDFTTYGHQTAPHLIRLNADYSVDSTFEVGTGFSPITNTLQLSPSGLPDDDFYAAGTFTTYDGTAVTRIARIRSDGSLDTTFDPGLGPSSTVQSVVPMGDASGRIYIAGSFATYDGTAQPYLARLLPDGSIDTTFVVATLNFPATSLAEATDGTGDIYVGGQFTLYGATTVQRIVRLTASGAIAAGWNSNPGFDSTVNEMAVAVDGSNDLYVVGAFVNYAGNNARRVARLNADGSFDAGFAAGTGFSVDTRAVLPAKDGSGDIFVGSESPNYQGAPIGRLIRLNNDGTVDASFNSGTGFDAGVRDIAYSGDDLVTVGAYYNYNGTPIKFVCWLDVQGGLLPGNPSGNGFQGSPYSTITIPDGTADTLVGGHFTSFNGSSWVRLARLNSDGTPDDAFSTGTGFNSFINRVATSPAGTRLYAGGFFSLFQGVTANYLIGLNGDGSRDSSFALGSGFDNVVNDLEVTPSGTIYVAGLFTTFDATGANRIIRLLPTGAIDTSFAYGSGFNGEVFDMAQAADGSGDLWVGGAFTTYQGSAYNRIVRLAADGSVNTSFNPGAGFNAAPLTIAPAQDGSGDIYAGGIFLTYQGAASAHIVRLNADGSRDTTFNVGSGFNFTTESVSVLTGTSEKIYVGGQFASYKGTAQTALVRLSNDGSLDTTFAIGLGPNLTVLGTSIVQDGSQDLIAVGDFTSFKTSTTQGLVRLSTSGNVK